MPTIAEAIAEWCEDPTRISPWARTLAMQAIADTLAGMIAGRNDESVRSVRIAAHSAGQPSGRSRTLGGVHTCAATAAMINGTAAHALDYDDNFTPGMSHASAVIVPALLAVADETGAQGRDFVTAYLLSLQGQAFIGWGVGYGHYVAGWHGTSTVGSLGTAVGVGWLRGLDRDGITRAISVAASLASGMKGQFGTPAKPFHAGLAARNSVEATALAAAGLRGRTDIIEAPQGFQAMFGSGPLGSGQTVADILACRTHVIETDGLLPKRHPCCGSTHMVVDALLDLQKTHGFTAGDVHSVETIVGTANWKNLAYSRPQNEMQARFSMNYCVARALRKGVLGLSDFTPEAVARFADDPLLDRISMTHHSADAEKTQPQLPHEVRVTLTSGKVFEASRLLPVGALADPFTHEDRLRKFADCCGPVLGPRVEGIFQRIEALDNEPDLGFLDELLAAG